VEDSIDKIRHSMKYRALIPVKTLQEAKSRLATHLTPSQRAQLMLDMLHHVLCVLHDTGAFESTTVVSADLYVLEQAHRWGAQARPEQAQGHNPALHAAALQELATCANEDTALLTISADLPLLRVQDVRKMLERAEQYDVVLAQSQEGTGTNALLVHPPLAVPYVFGPNSLQQFIAEAQQRQLRYTCYHSLGLSLDIDTYNDLVTLQGCGTGCDIAFASFCCL
jgi:2-phospho-L-lactate guanylyltransferase